MSLRNLLIASALALFTVSATATSTVPVEKVKQVEEISVPKSGKVVFRTTDEGVFKYTYIGKFLIEERTPGGTVTKFFYKDGKPIGILRKFGKADLAKKAEKSETDKKTGGSDKNGEEQFSTLSEACQIDEGGNLYNCSDWPEDSDPPGDWGGGGGGGGPIPGSDCPIDEYCPTPVADPLPGAAWWESPQRAWCMHVAYRSWLNQGSTCSTIRDPSRRAACNENNWMLYNEERDRCHAQYPETPPY